MQFFNSLCVIGESVNRVRSVVKGATEANSCSHVQMNSWGLGRRAIGSSCAFRCGAAQGGKSEERPGPAWSPFQIECGCAAY